MLLPLVVIFFSFCKMQAMEEEQKTITIYTMKTSFEIGYGNNTTISEVKKILENSERIPVDQQKLIAVVPATDWYLDQDAKFMATKTEELLNDVKIVELIENYGKGTALDLYLKTHKNPYKND